jgi:hypothetical protein
VTLRSDGWSVRPSFTPHGPTTPVTLLFDDAGFTQLAGAPAVAWQTPWSEVSHVRLLRRRRTTVVAMVVANTLYQWRRDLPLARSDAEELAATLLAHGAREMPRVRRNTALVVAAVVALASFGGYFASLAAPAATPAAVHALEALNLSARDVSGTWASTMATNASALSTVLPAPGQVTTDTSSSAITPDTAGTLAGVHFERCLGVASVDDRLFGLAGQYPLYDVASPIFSSTTFGGIQVQSDAQYYPNVQNVRDDVAEMSRPSFGRCFAQAVADEMVGRSSSTTPNLTTGVTLAETTFVRGWVRAGSESVALPLEGVGRATLVVVVEAADHYEVTLAALVGDYAAARTTIDDLVNAVLVRVTSTAAVSA